MIIGRYFLILITLIFFVFINACGKTDQAVDLEKTRLNQGDLAPLFVLEDFEGNKISSEDFTGKIVYVKFWASWCSICLAGLDELDILSNQKNDFNVITIVSPNYNGELPKEEFIKWYKSLTTDHITVLLDVKGIWAKEFGVLAYPTSYYIGTDGVLTRTIVGHNPNDTIKSEIQQIQ